MDIKKIFESGLNRYTFDFDLCAPNKGWAQIDTGSDAWYFGTWANPTRLKIVSYIEGDIIIKTANNNNEFIEEIRTIAKWHHDNDEFKGIDCMLNKNTEEIFISMGLLDLFHV